MHKKRLFRSLITGSLMLVSLAACEPDTPLIPCEQFIPEGEYGAGLCYTNDYRTLAAVVIENLNYHSNSNASDIMHVANFVDGLLINDPYGRLVKNLATHVENVGDTQFTFTIKENVPWMRSNGVQYIGGPNRAKQYVVAKDFVTTVRSVLDAATASKTAFMVAMFVEGAAEYAALSFVKANPAMYGITNNSSNQALATATEKCMLENFNIVRPNGVDPTTIQAIESFSLVGYRAIGTHELEIRLTTAAPFFPTMLTYAPFLPTNEYFLAEMQGASMTSNFGKALSNGDIGILFNGPYLLDTKSGSDQIVYKVNPEYHGNAEDAPSFMKTHIQNVVYTIVPAAEATNNAYARMQYESNKLDGFSINSKDRDGWEKYVIGDDPENPGTLEYVKDDPVLVGPKDPNVNSRYYTNVDSTWHMTMNVNRPIDTSGANSPAGQKSKLTYDEIVNSNRAMKIKEVRELFVKAFDFTEYNKRHGNVAIEQTQHQMNTFIPSEFAVDNNDVDYIEHLYEVYAEEENMTVEAARARLRPGQFDFELASGSPELAGYLDKANRAIELYNEMNPGDMITQPVKLESLSIVGSDPQEIYQEKLLTRSLNRRMNNVDVSTPTPENCPYFFIIDNDNIGNSDDFSTAVNAGHGTFVTWGWTPDYGDPLSYLNCYVTNGDMAFTVGTKEAVVGYSLSPDGETLVKVDNLLATYNSLVAAAAAESESYSRRYRLFAEAEYELLNNVYLMLPLYNLGVGWNASLSKAFSYGKPTSSYGMSNDRLTGMYILRDQCDRATRYEIYDQFLADQTVARAEGMIYIYDTATE